MNLPLLDLCLTLEMCDSWLSCDWLSANAKALALRELDFLFSNDWLEMPDNCSSSGGNVERSGTVLRSVVDDGGSVNNDECSVVGIRTVSGSVMVVAMV